MRSELIISTLNHGKVAIECESDLGPKAQEVEVLRGIFIHFRYAYTHLPTKKRVYKSTNVVDLIAAEVDELLDMYTGKSINL